MGELKKSLGLKRGALGIMVRHELEGMVRREVRKLIRKVLEEKFEAAVHKAVWGPIEEAREREDGH